MISQPREQEAEGVEVINSVDEGNFVGQDTARVGGGQLLVGDNNELDEGKSFLESLGRTWV